VVGLIALGWMVLRAEAEVAVLVRRDGKDCCSLYNPRFKKLPYRRAALQSNDWMKMEVAEPFDACAALTGDRYSGAIVMAVRGNCSFYDKALVVQNAGGAFLLVENTEDKYAQPGANSTSSEYDDINIPVAIIRSSSGNELKNSTNVQLKAFEAKVTLMEKLSQEVTSVILSAIAVVVIVFGSILATSSSRQGARESTGGGAESLSDSDQVTAVLVERPMLVFGVMCIQMMVLYFLYKYLVHFIIVCFCIGSTAAFIVVSSQLVSRSRTVVNVPVLNVTASTSDILLFLAGASLSATWYINRHANWAWTIQNVLGIFLMLLVLETLKLPTMKASTTLLSCLFLYDIFFVFITPLFTSTGESVMEKVAIGNGEKEHMPMVITMPNLVSPQSECLGSRGMSVLGYGDVIIPGLFITFLRSVDLKILENGGESSRGSVYFVGGIVAYVVGLLLTHVGLRIMRTAQPALMWIVPTLFISTFGLASLRGELKSLWSGNWTRGDCQTQQIAHEGQEMLYDGA